MTITKQILFCSALLYSFSILSALLLKFRIIKEIYAEGGIFSVFGALFVVYLLNLMLSFIFFIPTIIKKHTKG